MISRPERSIILSFIVASLIGAFLLILPVSSSGRSISFIDALFTATSAVCVTGLTVLDIGRDLSKFGQSVVLILIQAGGLGIMTISTMFIVMMGKRPSLKDRIAVHDTLFPRPERRGFPSIIKGIAALTLIAETTGFLLLFIFFFFIQKCSFLNALYFSLFHSISAFCNAGFSLFSDSFIRFQRSFFFNLTVCLLIISGGIGFLVISEIKEKKRFSSLSLHSKIAITTTLILLLSGTAIITLMEWKNTLKGLPVPYKILAGFFQSTTARTAGFNTVPIEDMTNATLFFLILLMFIGASPGSCGGGIKTTTFASILLLGISRLRGYEYPHAFRRTIAKETIAKSISIVMISTAVVISGLMLLLISESDKGFLNLMFETISAFGTVGLSTGITPDLSCTGKLILIFIMIIGRVGPLAIAIAISRQEVKRYYYAEEQIMVG